MEESFHFALPWVFFLLPLPLLVYFFLPRKENALLVLRSPFPSPQDLSSDAIKRSEPSKITLLWAFLTWIFLLLAAAQPEYLGPPSYPPTEGRDLILAVDLSESMLQKDFRHQGQRITRLEAVKRVAQDFILKRAGDRLGLILFADRAYTQTPLTFDLRSVAVFLQQAEVGLAGKRTAIGDAIALSVKRLIGREKHSRAIILLSDGTNTAGVVSPERAAKLAADKNIRIYTIGVGRLYVSRNFMGFSLPTGGGLDETMLKKIAEIGQGAYFRAVDKDSLKEAYRQIDALEVSEDQRKPYQQRRGVHYYFLLISLIFFSLFLVFDYRTY
ncbi:vWA domain-containing protein [Magnetococcales bacterium HHB-1]